MMTELAQKLFLRKLLKCKLNMCSFFGRFFNIKMCWKKALNLRIKAAVIHY